MKKLRSKDEVVVISGRCKGQRGILNKILDNGKCLVKGINLVKKHQKPDPQRGREGGIQEKEAPIDVSNIAIWNAETESADRVGFKIIDGKKTRIFKSNSKQLPQL